MALIYFYFIFGFDVDQYAFIYQPFYNISEIQINQTTAGYVNKMSPLRHILSTASRSYENRLQKRLLEGRKGAMAAAGGMSGPSWVGMYQAWSTPNLTKTERSDIFFRHSLDIAANGLMFAGGGVGIALGSTWMVSNSFFDYFEKQGPPKINGEIFAKQIADMVQSMLPSASQTYLQIKPYLLETMSNYIDLKQSEEFNNRIKTSMKIISDQLNLHSDETDPDFILDNWKGFYEEIQREMNVNHLPLNEFDNLDMLSVNEVGPAVYLYPQFVSISLLALKEWYFATKNLNKNYSRIQKIFDEKVRAFQKHYDLMINRMDDLYKKYIYESNYESIDSNTAMFTLKFPGMLNQQGTIAQKDAEPAFKFDINTEVPVDVVEDRSCRESNCKLISLLENAKDKSKSGRRVCTYERSYKEECQKPCSRVKQAFSILSVPFGLANTKCFKNKEKCKYTATGLYLKEETCKPSNASVIFTEFQNSLLAQIQNITQQNRELNTRYQYLLANATISDETSFIEGLEKAKSLSLQSIIPKDEVFNGDICKGKLAIPKSTAVPKTCIVTSIVKFGCPTQLNGKKQYIMYPDINRSKLSEWCPNYTRSEDEMMTKQEFEASSGTQLTEKEFLKIQSTRELKDDVIDPSVNNKTPVTAEINSQPSSQDPVGQKYQLGSVKLQYQSN